MGNSIVFTLRGPWRVPIQFDASLLVLAVLFAMLYIDRGIGTAAIAFAMIVLAILMHELGHAAACVAQNVPVRRVVLFGGGGFCEHDARVTPYQTEFIAIAGPLVNLALWAVASLILPLTITPSEPVLINGTWLTPPQGQSEITRQLTLFARLNLFLTLFNLVPVLPLDGGRLLHSWLHRFFRGITATKIAGGVGVVLAVAWVPLMFAAFFTFGVVLLYFPNIMLHWRMLRSGQG
ncbi:site-2 protease family protein [Rhodobacteraceae bacterium N5(2021)]|uniref:Site-2 protease family protein n=1 Tax=Gymnodinialimonas phycosphaerae TaxID=2841589 RepID=A0A975TXT0_9RHOB|nr:site-2 protease family protein [Gymnodinialimonas phycosphaerae]MBY4892382.1 site-2 protease family protein [Gymnodinialimonas phycosphaerae]